MFFFFENAKSCWTQFFDGKRSLLSADQLSHQGTCDRSKSYSITFVSRRNEKAWIVWIFTYDIPAILACGPQTSKGPYDAHVSENRKELDQSLGDRNERLERRRLVETHVLSRASDQIVTRMSLRHRKAEAKPSRSLILLHVRHVLGDDVVRIPHVRFSDRFDRLSHEDLPSLRFDGQFKPHHLADFFRPHTSCTDNDFSFVRFTILNSHLPVIRIPF